MIRLFDMRELVCDDGRARDTYVFSSDEPRAPTFRFEHDEEKKRFVLTSPDGRVEWFRDNLVRQLMVDPIPRQANCGR